MHIFGFNQTVGTRVFQMLLAFRPLLLSVLTWEMALEHRKGTGAPNLEPVLASGLLVLCFSSLVQVSAKRAWRDHFHQNPWDARDV